MNKENLDRLIDRYEDDLDRLYDRESHDELFKWRAMRCWREQWFKPADAFATFADRFTAAKKEFSLFIDGSRMHPSTGIVKLCEYEAEEVERLFREVLFADAHGDAAVVQDNMDRFIDGCESLRKKHFPANWSYKQDRHSASVFLAMNDPDFNFVYKASVAREMARYVDFGWDIGSGASFSLPNYYKLCEELTAALRERESLIEKHLSKLGSEHYSDGSLHLLAFNFMYCCYTYDYYKLLTLPSAGKAAHRKAAAEQEQARREAERLERISELERQLSELERDCDEAAEISLTGVRVTADKYGEGVVIGQDGNRISVRFAEEEKSYVLSSRFSARPRFEDDEYIVSVFTRYGTAQERMKYIRKELELLLA